MTRLLSALLLTCLVGHVAVADEGALAARIGTLLAEAEPGRWSSPDGAVSVELPQGWLAGGVGQDVVVVPSDGSGSMIQIRRNRSSRDLPTAVRAAAERFRGTGAKVLVERVQKGVGRVVVRTTHPTLGELQQDVRIVPRPGQWYLLVATTRANDPAVMLQFEQVLDTLRTQEPRARSAAGAGHREDDVCAVDFPRRPEAAPPTSAGGGITQELYTTEAGPVLHALTIVSREGGPMGSGAIAAVLQGAIDGLRDQGWSLARPKLQARFLQGRPGLQVLLQAHQADTRRYFAYWIVLDGDHLIQLGLRVPPPAADARSTREAFFSSLLLKR